MHLSPRLYAIGRLVPPGSRVADVGTDHGYLPIWLIRQGPCPFVIATDVAAGPLDAARRSAVYAGIASGIDFRLANGLDAVTPDEVDTVVIAGMGGETIVGILARTPWLKSGTHRLILQPQSKVSELLGALAAGGFRVEDQHLVREAGKLYTIFEVVPGAMEPPVGGFRYVSQALLERGDPLLESYLTRLCDKLSRAMQGLEKRADQAEKRAEFAKALADFESWRGA